MDADLTVVTRNRKKNLFFKQLSNALSDSGFAVVRYNKRTYQLRLKLKADASFAKSSVFRKTSKKPLKFIVDDAHDCVKWSGKTVCCDPGGPAGEKRDGRGADWFLRHVH